MVHDNGEPDSWVEGAKTWARMLCALGWHKWETVRTTIVHRDDPWIRYRRIEDECCRNGCNATRERRQSC